MKKVYVGLDLGSSSFHQTAISQDGAITMNRSFPTSEANLRAAFADLEGEIHVHLEAGELAPWAASIIAPLVTRVVCSHPRDNAWIAKDNDKCDRVDAYKLADLLRLNRFKQVHYAPDQPRRDFKQLVQHYDELTAHQARWKTKLKARLRMQESSLSLSASFPTVVARRSWPRSSRATCAAPSSNSTKSWTRACWPSSKRDC